MDVSDDLLERVRQVAIMDPEVRAVYVFGSQAVGGARPDSDLDLGVLYRTDQGLATTLRLEQDFERATGRKIDLVDVGRAHAFLALDIVRGERLFCRDSTETDRFDLYVLRRAGDLLPFERQRQALLARAPMSPGSISRVVVADKVAAVRRMLDGIRTLPLDNLAVFTADGRMVAAGDSYLRRALEALLDLARHVLAKGFGRAPAEYGEVARQLGEVGVVSPELAARLSLMARYRNRMVHFYDEITDQELYAILTGELGDIEAIIAAVTAWLVAHPDRVSAGE